MSPNFVKYDLRSPESILKKSLISNRSQLMGGKPLIRNKSWLCSSYLQLFQATALLQTLCMPLASLLGEQIFSHQSTMSI